MLEKISKPCAVLKMWKGRGPTETPTPFTGTKKGRLKGYRHNLNASHPDGFLSSSDCVGTIPFLFSSLLHTCSIFSQFLILFKQIIAILLLMALYFLLFCPK